MPNLNKKISKYDSIYTWLIKQVENLQLTRKFILPL